MKSTKLILSIIIISVMLSGCGSTESETLRLGMQCLENSDYTGALAYFDEAEAQGDDTELISRGRGIAKMGLADYEGAIGDFRASLDASGGHVKKMEFDTAFYLATALFKAGDAEGAMETYDAILGLDPKNSDALFLKGKAALSLGDLDEALKCFNRAIDNAPEDPDLYIDIYESLDHAGFASEGGSYLKSAMELRSITNYQKGKLYYWLQDYDNAKSCLEAVGDSEQNADVILYLGKTYEALGDRSYAASLYSSWLSKNPENVEICNQLGLCQIANGNYADALKSFQDGLKISGSEMTQSLRFNEIVAYEYLSDFKKASVLMDSYLKSYPDDENARREYIFLSSR
ncbi:MAG: tetratricopeptide repeat protein [Lachnospiraceae bacterium]|nr:tetratricopeptide repeat protein [Lachnospiraceae bacterium]